ncbi:MAG: aminomethyl-transferring glycine dehydrogenase subunit GcvPB [Clostridiales bacterium]|nr:aminomethyl-transferring glycine dehydrogenase subunit GcvPB [Clostridiales bacterium]
MKLIFERSRQGLRCATLRPVEVSTYGLKKEYLRKDLKLPEVAEVDLARHYTELSRNAFGVDSGFYPLGSCTMKYNPKLNEEVAALPGFTKIHPLQDEESVQGCLHLMADLSGDLMELTGMDGMTLQPCAGAHGEFTGLMLIAAYHESRKDKKRTKILVPDTAHGTNPASAVMAGFEVVNIPSNAEKGVDLDALRAAVGDDTAALMLTNPTTLGLFEKNIEEISKIVHDAGGLLYYDGANLNAIMGVVRPGDMGFDVIHLNLHKTFSTPHGGGGPGSGPVGCKEKLVQFLPNPSVIKDKKGNYQFECSKKSIGKVSSFYGNFAVMVKAFAYIKTLGGDGIKESAEHAVLNANYMKAKLQDIYPTDTNRYCMHEFVIDIQKLKNETGVSAKDIAKAMIDRGMHPPTMYFPHIPGVIDEALMIEPTETESKQTLDDAVAVLRELYELAFKDPKYLQEAPHNMAIGRPDEVAAARKPIVRFEGEY